MQAKPAADDSLMEVVHGQSDIIGAGVLPAPLFQLPSI
jgi:hypothetical protein